jgi:hypothetical protein
VNSSSSRATSRAPCSAPRWAWATTARCCAGRRAAAGGVQRHAGRRPPLPVHRGTRAAGPQGAGGQPERPGRLRRRSRWPSRWRWRCRAPTRPSSGRLARGLFALADRHGIELVGGDTTAGPLNLCITVGPGARGPGAAAQRRAAGRRAVGQRHAGRRAAGAGGLPRHGSVAGDAFERVRRAMECPEPRVALGLALRGLATSAIDISDGLLGDLGHILRRSGVARASSWRRCRAAPCWPRSRARCSTSACCAAATTTSCCSPPRRRRGRGAARGRRGRRGGHAHRHHRGRTRPAVVDEHGREQHPPRAASTTSHDGRASAPCPTTCRAAPRRRFMVGHPARWLALGFGSGLSPKAPGTVGTLWAWAAFLVLDAWLDDHAMGRADRAVLTVGWWACTRTRSTWARGRPRRHRLGRGGGVLDRAVAADAGRVGAGRGLRAVPLLRRRQARAGGLGRPAVQAQARPGHRLAQGAGILFDDLVAAACTLLVIAVWIRLWNW